LERRQASSTRRTAGRLSRSAEFDRVYRQGRSVANRYLVLYAFPRGGEETTPRLGLSVGRKVGGAVERNLVKRLLREAFGAAESDLSPGYDIVVVARPDARELAASKGLSGISDAVGELLAKAGMRAPAGAR
jgi:ribonuclease P protein component